MSVRLSVMLLLMLMPLVLLLLGSGSSSSSSSSHLPPPPFMKHQHQFSIRSAHAAARLPKLTPTTIETLDQPPSSQAPRIRYSPRIELPPAPTPEPVFDRTQFPDGPPTSLPSSDPPPLSSPGRWLHTAVLVHENMIVYGGVAEYSNRFYNDIWLFNYGASSWTQLQASYLPPLAPTLRATRPSTGGNEEAKHASQGQKDMAQDEDADDLLPGFNKDGVPLDFYRPADVPMAPALRQPPTKTPARTTPLRPNANPVDNPMLGAAMPHTSPRIINMQVIPDTRPNAPPILEKHHKPVPYGSNLYQQKQPTSMMPQEETDDDPIEGGTQQEQQEHDQSQAEHAQETPQQLGGAREMKRLTADAQNTQQDMNDGQVAQERGDPKAQSQTSHVVATQDGHDGPEGHVLGGGHGHSGDHAEAVAESADGVTGNGAGDGGGAAAGDADDGQTDENIGSFLDARSRRLRRQRHGSIDHPKKSASSGRNRKDRLSHMRFRNQRRSLNPARRRLLRIMPSLAEIASAASETGGGDTQQQQQSQEEDDSVDKEQQQEVERAEEQEREHLDPVIDNAMWSDDFADSHAPADLWKYSLETGIWEQMLPQGSSIPPSRWLHTAVVFSDNSMVVFGGVSYGGAILGDVWILDVARGTWLQAHPENNGPPILPREGHSAVVAADDKMLVFGGVSYGSDPFNDLWEYDPLANVWRMIHGSTAAVPGTASATSNVVAAADAARVHAKGHLPAPRWLHSAAYYTNRAGEGIMFVFGGAPQAGNSFNDLHAFYVASGVWSHVRVGQAVPPARVLASMVLVNRFLVLVGGSSGRFPRDDMWVFDCEANVWTEELPSGAFPFAREGASLVVVNPPEDEDGSESASTAETAAGNSMTETAEDASGGADVDEPDRFDDRPELHFDPYASSEDALAESQAPKKGVTRRPEGRYRKDVARTRLLVLFGGNGPLIRDAPGASAGVVVEEDNAAVGVRSLSSSIDGVAPVQIYDGDDGPSSSIVKRAFVRPLESVQAQRVHAAVRRAAADEEEAAARADLASSSRTSAVGSREVFTGNNGPASSVQDLNAEQLQQR